MPIIISIPKFEESCRSDVARLSSDMGTVIYLRYLSLKQTVNSLFASWARATAKTIPLGASAKERVSTVLPGRLQWVSAYTPMLTTHARELFLSYTHSTLVALRPGNRARGRS